MLVLGLVSSASAQDALNSSSLAALVDAPAGTYLSAAPGQPSTVFLANGSALTVDGPADPQGWLPVTANGSRGWVQGAAVAALPSSYMPSAGDSGLFLPVGDTGAFTPAISVDPSGTTLTLSMLPGTGPSMPGRVPQAPTGNTSLLGVASGNQLPGGIAGQSIPTGGNTVPTGSGAPAPAPTGSPAGGWNRRILATAQGASGKSASGLRLGANDLFVALPSPSALRQTVTVQLSDAQGNGYGPAISGQVRDVGPWQVADAYWQGNRRPHAEALRGSRVAWKKGVGYVASSKGRRCNGAGIDISAALWCKLKPGISRSTALNTTGQVNWTFGAGDRAD